MGSLGWCRELVSAVCSLVRSFVGRGHKSSQVWSGVCCARKGPCCFCRLQIENPDYRRRRRAKKMTEFPFSCYAQPQQNDQQRLFFSRFWRSGNQELKFRSRPLLLGSGCEGSLGMGGGFKNHEQPLSELWDPCLAAPCPVSGSSGQRPGRVPKKAATSSPWHAPNRNPDLSSATKSRD